MSERHTTLISSETLSYVETYLLDLRHGRKTAGGRLKNILKTADLNGLSPHDLLLALVKTKVPQIFAESQISGNGYDWNLTELRILGDVGMAVPVLVFDDAAHTDPDIHETPFEATLLFTAGALLRTGSISEPADWNEVHVDEKLDQGQLKSLYSRRLKPVFTWINEQAQTRKPALVTIPGLGCGQFAGPYTGTMGARLEIALMDIIRDNAGDWENIAAIWFDPYSECEPRRDKFGDINFFTRPLAKDVFPRPQLSDPRLFGFADCDLYSLVAWDHASWPGNDFFVNSRTTDDGVKAAATNSMSVLTGFESSYEKDCWKYLPPVGYSSWDDVVKKNGLELGFGAGLVII